MERQPSEDISGVDPVGAGGALDTMPKLGDRDRLRFQISPAVGNQPAVQIKRPLFGANDDVRIIIIAICQRLVLRFCAPGLNLYATPAPRQAKVLLVSMLPPNPCRCKLFSSGMIRASALPFLTSTKLRF